MDNSGAIDPHRQWLNDGGGRVVIGWVVMEIERFYCVGAARDPINSIVDHKKIRTNKLNSQIRPSLSIRINNG